MRRPNFSLKHALIIAGVVLLAVLVMDFNSRVSDLRRQSAQKQRVSAELEGLQLTQVLLQTQIAYATSEAAVIEWAYNEGNLVRPGDNPVVPVPPAGSAPVPTPRPTAAPERVSNLDVWLWLFFDEVGISGGGASASP
ncbi:MAG TPA: hypothetical protein VJL34_04870 [Anaerolineales bacterium]|nr:hypothetical protein [Anaerolineales bacterium]